MQADAVTDRAIDALIVASTEGVIEAANPAALALLRVKDTSNGARLSDLLPVSERAVWTEALEQSRRGEATEIEIAVSWDGGWQRVCAHVAPLGDAGHVRKLVIVLRHATRQMPRLPLTLADVEKAHIDRTLQAHDFNRTHTARELGIARATLIKKIKEYKLDAGADTPSDGAAQ